MRASVLALCCALVGCHAGASVEAKAPSAKSAIEIEGDPNGLYWDAGTLYIADGAHDRLLAWTDAGGTRTFATLPAAEEQHPGLGQLVRIADGTFVVTRFGFGKTGAIAYVRTDGVGDTLYVSDQAAGQVLRAPLGANVVATPFAVVPGADLLCAGPNGDVFAGSTTGAVYRISADGHAAVFASGLQAVRGVAYDTVGKRLFIAEHGADGPRHRIRIVPVS